MSPVEHAAEKASEYAAEIDALERALLDIRGIHLHLERDSLGFLKLRVQWDSFIVLEVGVGDDQDWRDALRWAKRYIDTRIISNRRDSDA